MTNQPRKFHIRSYNNRHTVYEILSRGERARVDAGEVAGYEARGFVRGGPRSK